MADRKIDYDRPGGVVIRIIADLGMDVFMYKADPGVYLSAYGKPVSADLARRAGFEVDRLEKLRQRKLRMAQAADAIEQELEIGARAGVRDVVAEKDGFKVIVLGAGRHIVEDPDGNVLTPGASLTKEIAVGVMEQLAKAAAAPVSEVNVAPGRPVPPADGARDGGRTGFTPLRPK